VDRDGKPVQGAEIRVDNQTTHQPDYTKTNKNGDYSIVGLYAGKYKAYLFIGGKPVMIKGDGVGNELAITETTDMRVNFDMKDAPTTTIVVPGVASGNTKEKAAADKKNNEEMKAAFNLGAAAMKANNFEEAVKQYQLAAEKDPGQPAIFGNMGVALAALKKYDDAVAAYRKSLALKQDDATTQPLFNITIANTGKIDKAMQAVEVAKLDPIGRTELLYNLGAILTNRGKSGWTVEVFKKRLRLTPRMPSSYSQLGIAYFSLDGYDSQATALEKYLELQPTERCRNRRSNSPQYKAQAPKKYSRRALAPPWRGDQTRPPRHPAPES
jgi:tetratricopeptide (TPR) repeat protein